MFKIMFFVWLLLPATFRPVQQSELPESTCQEVSNLQKTGQTSSSISFSWTGTSGATQYRVWYYRPADNYTSGAGYTSSTSHTFTGLTAGTYTFYFQTICDGEASGFIGWEDVVSN